MPFIFLLGVLFAEEKKILVLNSNASVEKYRVAQEAFREAIAEYYQNRFGVSLDPNKEVLPLLAGGEGHAR